MKQLGIFICSVFLVACDGSEKDENELQSRVYISNNSVQCEYQGDTPETTANELIQSSIDILESNCANKTGVAVISLSELLRQK